MKNTSNKASASAERDSRQSSGPGFFTTLYRRFAPLAELRMVVSEMPPLVSYNIPEITIPEITPVGLNVPIIDRYATINRQILEEALSAQQGNSVLLAPWLTEAFSNRDLSVRPEIIIRQDTAAETAAWWRAHRQQRRAAEFSGALTVLSHATRLEEYPDLEIDEIDEAFVCSISREIMTNPVL